MAVNLPHTGYFPDCGCPSCRQAREQFTAAAARDKEPSNILKVGPLELEAAGDYIILLRDEFRSGYECPKCEGEGVIRCDSCGGTGRSLVVKDGRCTQCMGNKSMACPDCGGKGVVAGGLVIPEDRQNEPTTGTIVSMGPEVSRYGVGNSVMFPSYAGHQLKLTGETPEGEEREYLVVVMHQTEIICHCRGQLELRRLKKKVAASTTA
jgi:co-chaperonin GroES (HSP10)